MASSTSPATSIPRSPWRASAGCRNIAGVPVLESVAATLRPIRPDFPIPVTTTRPRQPSSSSTALSKRPSSRSCRSRMACASISSTRRATSRLMLSPLTHERSELVQAVDQRDEPVQVQRVSPVGKRSLGSIMDFHKYPVDAHGYGRPRQRLDVFRLASAVVAGPAGNLDRMRGVENHGKTHAAQIGQRPHVHHEVLVAKLRSALGDENAFIAGARNLLHCVDDFPGRQKLPFL